jgi:hypothetical protein
MDTTTLLIIVIIVLLVGGGGWRPATLVLGSDGPVLISKGTM